MKQNKAFAETVLTKWFHLVKCLLYPPETFLSDRSNSRTMRKIEAAHRNLIIALGSLFFLGVALAVSNAACAINMGRLFAPFLYGVALVGLATGGAITLLFQWKVDKMQLKRILSILPVDEASVLTTIIEKREYHTNRAQISLRPFESEGFTYPFTTGTAKRH